VDHHWARALGANLMVEVELIFASLALVANKERLHEKITITLRGGTKTNFLVEIKAIGPLQIKVIGQGVLVSNTRRHHRQRRDESPGELETK
jgi:hypothetical protein